MSKQIVPLPPLEDLGPAMRALKKDAHRVFAWHYANNGANASEAALAAGWGSAIAYQTGWRLKQNDAIQAAVLEINDKNLAAGGAVAIKALMDVVNDPSHKGHMKGIELLLERSGHDIKKKTSRNSELSDEQIVEKAIAFAIRFELPLERILGASIAQARLPLPKPAVDAEFTEVDDELAELF